MKITIIVIQTFFFSYLLSAQIQNTAVGSNGLGGQLVNYGDASLFNKAIKNSTEKEYANIAGSPFLSDEHINAYIMTTDSIVIKDVPIKIDLNAKYIYATNIDGNDLILDEEKYLAISFPFEGQQIMMKKVNPKSPFQFYEVLFESDDVVFFKERYVTIREGSNYGLSKTDTKFSHRQHYFLRQGIEVEKVKLKSKEILPLLPKDKSKAIQDFAKSNKNNLKSETDFVEVFKATYQ